MKVKIEIDEGSALQVPISKEALLLSSVGKLYIEYGRAVTNLIAAGIKPTLPLLVDKLGLPKEVVVEFIRTDNLSCKESMCEEMWWSPESEVSDSEPESATEAPAEPAQQAEVPVPEEVEQGQVGEPEAAPVDEVTNLLKGVKISQRQFARLRKHPLELQHRYARLIASGIMRPNVL